MGGFAFTTEDRSELELHEHVYMRGYVNITHAIIECQRLVLLDLFLQMRWLQAGVHSVSHGICLYGRRALMK